MNCRILLFILPLFIIACGSQNKSSPNGANQTDWTPPAAGIIVAADSMKIKDPLNDFYFAVKLVSSPSTDMPGTMGFVYDLDIHSGPNQGLQRITMPHGGDHLKPLLRRAKDGSTEFIIGFIPGKQYGGVMTFQDYYSIKADGKVFKITALKNYTFQ